MTTQRWLVHETVTRSNGMPETPNSYLNVYHPLIMTAAGRHACERRRLDPFVDASIRREPDLEYRWPTISALCRGAMFAPRLQAGDVVVYLTVKGRWGDHPTLHRRLTAVLRVRHRFENHVDAADWFAHRRLPLPNNCLVPGNKPKPLNQSHGVPWPATCGDRARILRRQDAFYRRRVRRHGTFLICQPLFINIEWDAPIVEDEHLRSAFGRVPGMRTPGALPSGHVNRFLRSRGIAVRLSAR
jgi:hypothetical protein